MVSLVEDGGGNVVEDDVDAVINVDVVAVEVVYVDDNLLKTGKKIFKSVLWISRVHLL